MTRPMRLPDGIIERQQAALANLAKVGGVELNTQQIVEAVRCVNRQLLICMASMFIEGAATMGESTPVMSEQQNREAT